MKLTATDKFKLKRKEKTIRNLGKQIFEKAENPKNLKEIRRNITSLLFELNALSPRYLLPSDDSVKELQNWITASLNDIATVEHFSEKQSKTDPHLWYIIAPRLSNFGNILNKTYFIFNKTELKVIFPPLNKGENKQIQQKIYAIGEAYDFYTDISNIIFNAKNEVIITDRYPNEELFVLYLEKVKIGVKIRIMSREVNTQTCLISNKFKLRPKVNYEMRYNHDWHDRLIFIDNNCWVCGQALKDAATNAPTYLIKLEAYDKLKAIFEQEWEKSTVIDESFLKQLQAKNAKKV